MEVARAAAVRVCAHARSAESVKMCVRHGVDVVYHATYADDEAKDLLESVKDRVFVAPALSVTWTRLHEAGNYGLPSSPAMRSRIARDLELTIACMIDLKGRGVRVLPGGDYGFRWNPHGNNARDLAFFVDLMGFTPMEAIVAATKHGAMAAKGLQDFGTLEVGKLADLVVLDADPLASIANIRKIRSVMKEGQLINPQSLPDKPIFTPRPTTSTQ